MWNHVLILVEQGGGVSNAGALGNTDMGPRLCCNLTLT